MPPKTESQKQLEEQARQAAADREFAKASIQNYGTVGQSGAMMSSSDHQKFIDRKREEMTADEYKQFRRSQIAELADWHPAFDIEGVSVSDADKKQGSPKYGDKIARNPANHADRWLVAADYFSVNFEPISPHPAAQISDERIRELGKDAFGIDLNFDGALMKFARALLREAATKEGAK